MTAIDSSLPTPQTATQTESITIAPRTVVVRTAKLRQAIVSEPFSETLVAKNGEPPYTWARTSGTLPPGLTLGTDATIQGIPTTTGSFAFTAKVTDSYSPATTATKSLTLIVAAAR